MKLDKVSMYPEFLTYRAEMLLDVCEAYDRNFRTAALRMARLFCETPDEETPERKAIKADAEDAIFLLEEVAKHCRNIIKQGKAIMQAQSNDTPSIRRYIFTEDGDMKETSLEGAAAHAGLTVEEYVQRETAELGVNPLELDDELTVPGVQGDVTLVAGVKQ